MWCRSLMIARRALVSGCCSQQHATNNISTALQRHISCTPALLKRPVRKKKSLSRAVPPVPYQTWNAAELAARLYRLMSVQERVYLIDEHSASVVLECLREFGFTEDQLVDTFLSSPHLLRRGLSAWRGTCSVLLEHGFAPEDVLHMFATSPAVLDTSGREILARFSALVAGTGASDGVVLDLVKRRPQLLLIPENRLKRQLAELLTVFTQDQVSRVVARSPTVLHEAWTDTSRKIDYLIHTMGLTPTDIAFSSGMAFPLEHIRARHLVLERSGSYTRPRPKDTAPIGNPTLTEIVDHSDELFCQRVARLPPREYEVFRRIAEEEFAAEDRAAEREAAGESDGEADSESGSESEEDDAGSGYKRNRKGR